MRKNIEKEMFLTDAKGQAVAVEKKEKSAVSEEVLVYNFHVEEFCSYFVSDCSILVHNSSSQRIGDISEKAIKDVKKKWGKRGIQAFEKARLKGFVGPEGTNGIKKLKGNGIKKGTNSINMK